MSDSPVDGPDWEARYQESDTPWDLGQAAPGLAQLMRERPVLFKNVKSALVSGCGRGHDAIYLAKTIPHVTGLDLSHSALTEARQLDEEKNVTWEVGDFLKKMDAPDPRFDMIWEHTCFCAIPLATRQRYATNAHHLLKPNGFLLGVFFLDPGIPLKEGPPFDSSMEGLKEIFNGNFVLEWHDSSPESTEKRKGREVLALWRRLGSCADGSCSL